jgi:predicted glycosyl hydrolase (DUF1957 family)
MTADEAICTRLIIEKCELCASDWEFEAENSKKSDAIVLLDHAKRIRTIAECLKQDLLEEQVMATLRLRV